MIRQSIFSPKWVLIAVVIWASFPQVGCKTNTVQPPLAPGYINSTDQSMGETLAAAHAFYHALYNDSQPQNGQPAKWTPKPQEKTALNALEASLNVAQPLYLAYHQGSTTVSVTEVQNAVADVIAKQAALQSQIGGR